MLFKLGLPGILINVFNKMLTQIHYLYENPVSNTSMIIKSLSLTFLKI